MRAHEAEAAARVIERLLVDPAFRGEFRRDPASACREAGLQELAEEMSMGAGKAMHTLEVRESRSSLAGVMMAAALEGIGVFALVENIAPSVGGVPGAVRDVLSRVNLPAVDSVRGSLAAPPPAAPGQPTEQAPGGGGAQGGAGAPAATPPAAPAPASVVPEEAVDKSTAAGAADAARRAAVEREGADERPRREADGSRSRPADAGTARPEDAGTPPTDDAPPLKPDGAASAPVDPEQFGMEGTGGAPSAEALALLENKRVMLDADGIADIKEGRIDPRIVAVLTKLSEKHTIQVSCMCRDHAMTTTSGSISNHYYGRGVDIAAVDGAPVNAANIDAREIATELGTLDRSIQPTEIGTPWQIGDPRYFTDSGHQDHLHVGFDRPIEPSWKPPADVAAGGGSGGSGGSGGGAGAVAGAPAGAPSGATAVAASGTLSLPVPERGAGGSSRGETLSIEIPAQEPRRPPVERASAAVASAAAEPVDKGAAQYGGAGPKAVAALEEALKHKGTPYLWGGSTPKTGFDCSGLVQWAYAQQGIRIPRVTDQQILAPNGTEVKRGDLLPGDLVFFRDPSGYVYHVGISLGGDRFLHAPRTGDVVKESSLDEPYYAERFTGGRRFDEPSGRGAAAPEAAAAPDPGAVEAAQAARARDAEEVKRPNTLTFKALSRQEAIQHSSTVQFMRAIRPEEAAGYRRASVVDAAAAALDGPMDYPGDDAPKSELAAWMGRKAAEAGLPRELPVMAALVESNLTNIQGGDRDSVGFFQMRLGIWNKGEYAGYPSKPELQLKWFIDTALAVKKQRLARGETGFLSEPSKWGEWVADVERPQENLRYKYALQLQRARQLLAA